MDVAGEAFMRMFDDYDESAPQPQQPFSSEGDDASSSGAGGSDSEDGGSEDDAAADAANGQKAQPAVEETIFDDRRWRSKGGASTSKPAAAAFAASGRTGGKPLRPGAPSGASVASASPSAAALKFALLRKAQKKKFMSAKAADIFEDVDVSTLAPALAAKGGANRDADEGGVTPEEWRKMQQEVELLGALRIELDTNCCLPCFTAAAADSLLMLHRGCCCPCLGTSTEWHGTQHCRAVPVLD